MIDTLTTTDPTESQTLAERLVTGLSRRWTRDVSRRGFLWRSTLVATALTVDPFDFVLKPQSAYASVCGQSASCASGWTAFCATIQQGANTCPPGSYAAGWWRIDDSPFCRGDARYIIDCNRSPEASCDCRCADGPCDKRRTCCNNFRYGQCHQEVPGVTEVVCRVALCMAPWDWDETCTTTLRVDNRTVTHNSSYLPGADATHIDIRYQDLGQTGSALGSPTTGELTGPRGGRVRRFDNGVITFLGTLGAWETTGPRAAEYARLDRVNGPLGYITAAEEPLPDGRGVRTRTEGGPILWSPGNGAHAVMRPMLSPYRRWSGWSGPLGYPIDQARGLQDGVGSRQRFEGGITVGTPALGYHAVHGAVFTIYNSLWGPPGPLGYPTTEQEPVPDGRGTRQAFEHGRIFTDAGTGTHAVVEPFWSRYLQKGGAQGPLGYPIDREKPLGGDIGRWQNFEHGRMYSGGPKGVQPVLDPLVDAYVRLGGPAGPLGFPLRFEEPVPTDQEGRLQRFERGTIFWHPDVGSFGTYGPIEQRYKAENGVNGPLGYPVTDPRERNDGDIEQVFQGGTIVHDPDTGTTTVT